MDDGGAELVEFAMADGNAGYIGNELVPQKHVDGICVTKLVETDTEVTVTQEDELLVIGGTIDDVIFGEGGIGGDGEGDVLFDGEVGRGIVVELEGVEVGANEPPLWPEGVEAEKGEDELTLGLGMLDDGSGGRDGYVGKDIIVELDGVGVGDNDPPLGAEGVEAENGEDEFTLGLRMLDEGNDGAVGYVGIEVFAGYVRIDTDGVGVVAIPVPFVVV